LFYYKIYEFYRLQISVKNKQNNTTVNCTYNWVLQDECFDSVVVSYVEILSVSTIVAPGLRANQSVADIEFLKIVSIQNIMILLYFIMH